MSTAQLEVSRLAVCNRCGDEQVAWVQGAKSGKWYLAEAQRLPDGTLVALRFNFHRCGSR